jgi:radical SAM/Cys-rich protein
MQDTRPLLIATDFPAISRLGIETLQVNLGYRCNQSCVHCHVNAGPARTEAMSRETIDEVLSALQRLGIATLDITGGAPELNPHFRYLVQEAVGQGVKVIDRCNLTILEEPDQSGLAEFLAAERVEITASLPCYLEDNVDAQRGKGVYERSIAALQRLNALGYGVSDGLILNLVFNPLGPTLPPAQEPLEKQYRISLGERFGVRFTRLLTLANLPVQRFGAILLAQNQYHSYLDLLKRGFNAVNLEHVMCRRLISVDWRGFLYDCDFNQMLALPIRAAGEGLHVRELGAQTLRGNAIRTGEHCYGCTAGQGSSCSGALAA